MQRSTPTPGVDDFIARVKAEGSRIVTTARSSRTLPDVEPERRAQRILCQHPVPGRAAVVDEIAKSSSATTNDARVVASHRNALYRAQPTRRTTLCIRRSPRWGSRARESPPLRSHSRRGHDRVDGAVRPVAHVPRRRSGRSVPRDRPSRMSAGEEDRVRCYAERAAETQRRVDARKCTKRGSRRDGEMAKKQLTEAG